MKQAEIEHSTIAHPSDYATTVVESPISEGIFRRIFEEANEGIWILDENAVIQLINPRMAQMLGYSREEMRGRHKWDFVVPEDQDLAREHFDCRRRGISEQFEIRFRHKDGRGIWAIMAARPIFHQGQFRGALDFISENTVSKQAQLKLAEAQIELEHRVAERTAELQETVFHLESFSYSLAHDMRAPLRAVSGYAHILATEHSASLDGEARELIRRMTDAALRMDHLIRDVLSYNFLVRGEMPLASVDLAKLVQDIVRDYPEFEQWQQFIQIECRGCRVNGNAAALTQVISNILSNALKFVPPGVTPCVRVWCENGADKVRLNINDNGVGIPRELQHQIWGVFHRLHTNEYPGTGIGLAIVKAAVERMGGTVGVESEKGKGSTFWFELAMAERCAP